MKTNNFPVPDAMPDYVIEHDVFGLEKSKRTSVIEKLKFKPLNVPDLEVTYARTGIRALAAFIDVFILLTFLLIPEALFFSFNFSNFDINIYRLITGTAIWVVYHAAFDSSKYQATIGKKLLNLKIIDINGNKLTFTRAAFRCLMGIISVLSIGLGILNIPLDRKKRGWHDLIVGSYVITS